VSFVELARHVSRSCWRNNMFAASVDVIIVQ
jgi:hypothetical protein